jgi:NADPH:quinone reductase
MPKAAVLHKAGGPDSFVWEDVRVGDPGPGQVRLRTTAVGLNFVETLFRAGRIPMAYPAILGFEGVGVIEAVAPGVTEVKPGDRICYVSPPSGAYAETRLLPAADCVVLPDAISDEVAAASYLKGTTAYYLLRRSTRVKPGDTVLVHAAAGGVGLLLCQWAKHLGATVIGTVGSDDKAELARAHGCDHVVVYTRDDFLPVVKDVTGGRGVQAVYESIGRDTFDRSAASLALEGTLVAYGAASGPRTPEQTAAFPSARYLIGTTLQDYTATRADLLAAASGFFDVVTGGAVRVTIGQKVPLRNVGEAHAALESRRTTGSTVLTV